MIVSSSAIRTLVVTAHLPLLRCRTNKKPPGAETASEGDTARSNRFDAAALHAS
jgi:hypothetical protein